MIEGLHFDLEHEELRNHLEERAEYHAERADWYQARYDELKAGGVESDAAISGGNPLSNIESNVEKHKKLVQLFGFMADHLVKTETYRLSENDLIRIEIIGSKRYF